MRDDYHDTPSGEFPAPLPEIGILPHRGVLGLNEASDAVPMLEFLPLDQALEKSFTTDAHFVAYRLVDGAGNFGPHPRLNKPFLPQARMLDLDILTVAFVVDIDTPKHVEWTEDLFGRYAEQLIAALDRPAIKQAGLDRYTAHYLTTGGARLIYVLDKPIPADLAESKLRFVISELAAGLPLFVVDSLYDWTRLFRLPRVVREMDTGARIVTEDSTSFMVEIDPEARVDASKVPSIGPLRPVESYQLSPEESTKPTESEVWEILEDLDSRNHRRPTPLVMEAKKRLRGRDCYPVLFEGVLLAPEGKRDTTLMAMIGQAAGLLASMESMTARGLYALFYDAVAQLEPDAQTPDWTENAWVKIQRIWSQERGKEQARQREVTGDPKVQEVGLNGIANGMRAWCNDERLHSAEPGTVSEFVKRHFIASCGKYNYVMGRNGRYGRMPLSDPQLVAFLRTSGLDDFLPTRKMLANGSPADVSCTEIKNLYSVPVGTAIDLEPEIDGGYIRDFSIIKKDDDTSVSSTVPTLVLPCYRRNPRMEPVFSQEVDAWMQVFFGEQYAAACRWIAWALAFDERETCALSLVGPPGAGKKLFVQGLAECLESPALASGDDIVGQYQYGLLESPFVVVNEGWPQARKRHPADGFRSIVSGDDQIVELKYLPTTKIRSFPRIIFTANNFDVISRITDGKSLTNEDREALSQRLLHIDLGMASSSWLKARGGRDYTGRKGNRWISDKGGNSDYVLAKHFLWLYSRRGPVPTSRFLVEGNASDDILFGLQTRTGDMPAIIETILNLLSMPNARQHGLIVEEKRILTTPKAIVEHYRRAIRTSSGGRPLGANEVIAALRTIAESDSPLGDPRTPAEHKTRWWELDLHLLHRAAERDGWPTEVLDRIINGEIVGQKETELTSTKDKINLGRLANLGTN